MNWLFMVLITSLCMTSYPQAADVSIPDGVLRKIFIDVSSNGKRVDLKTGGEVQIELQGTGSTGYSWRFDQLDPDFFEILHEERREIRGETNDLTGIPLQYIWKLKSKRSGRSTIRMDYYRPWEGREKAIQRFEVSVDLHP